MFENQNKDDALRFDIRELGGGYKLSRNFTLQEAQSQDLDPIVWLHPSVIVLVQTLRDEFGRIQINSWYRSKSHNKAIGGVNNSKHTWGLAVDIKPIDADLNLIKRRVLEMNIGGVGFYDTFVHLDVFGTKRFWNYESARS